MGSMIRRRRPGPGLWSCLSGWQAASINTAIALEIMHQLGNDGPLSREEVEARFPFAGSALGRALWALDRRKSIDVRLRGTDNVEVPALTAPGRQQLTCAQAWPVHF